MTAGTHEVDQEVERIRRRGRRHAAAAFFGPVAVTFLFIAVSMAMKNASLVIVFGAVGVSVASILILVDALTR